MELHSLCGYAVTIPMFALVIRKAYGLGVQAMCGGSSQVPFSCATWPTGEFAGMGIEGSIKLGQYVAAGLSLPLSSVVSRHHGCHAFLTHSEL